MSIISGDAELCAHHEDARYTLDEFEVKDDVQARLPGDDVAIVAYRVHEQLTVEGEPVTLDAADSSTWVRRDGRWVCALHTEAIAGDPFGRDRRPARQAGASRAASSPSEQRGASSTLASRRRVR